MTVTWITSVKSRRFDGATPSALVPEATFGFTHADGPGPEEIGLDQVTTHGWRVTDDRLPLRDPFRVLGFIEYQAERFEVRQIGFGFEWHSFGTLEDALAHIVSTASELAQQRIGTRELDHRASEVAQAVR